MNADDIAESLLSKFDARADMRVLFREAFAQGAAAREREIVAYLRGLVGQPYLEMYAKDFAFEIEAGAGRQEKTP